MERMARTGPDRKRGLSEEEGKRLERRVAEVERRSGAQIVLAVVARSDSHPELPWKAFALGTVAGGILAAAVAFGTPSWLPGLAAYLAVAATLAGGLIGLLTCLLMPPFARLLLDSQRAEAEARQYADSLFLDRELHATSARSGVLLLVSLFERRVVLRPDRGLEARLGVGEMERVVARVTAELGSGSVARALTAGLDALAEVLGTVPGSASGGDELPNKVIEEAGE